MMYQNSWVDLTCSTAFLTFSIVLAVTNACRGSSSPGSICPSFRPTFPSFTEPLPRIMILAQHSFSMFFSVLPLVKPKRKTWESNQVWTLPTVNLVAIEALETCNMTVLLNPIYRGPISRPTKLISGYSSWGIITLSLTLVAGGLQKTNLRQAFTGSHEKLSNYL